MQSSFMQAPYTYSPESMDNEDGTTKKQPLGELAPRSSVTSIMDDVNRELWNAKVGEDTFAELRMQQLKYTPNEKEIALLHENKIAKMSKEALLKLDPSVADCKTDEDARAIFLNHRATLIHKLHFANNDLEPFKDFLKMYLLYSVTDPVKQEFLANSIAINFHQSGIAVAVSSYFSLKAGQLLAREQTLQNDLLERITGFVDPERIVVINYNAASDTVTFDSTVTYNGITTERDKIGYELFLMSKNEFDALTPDKKNAPILVKNEKGGYSLYGNKNGEWQLAPLKNFKIPPEWNNEKKVFVSANTDIFKKLKVGHTLYDNTPNINSYKAAECALRLMSKKPTPDERKKFISNTVYLYINTKGEPKYMIASSQQEQDLSKLPQEHRDSIKTILQQQTSLSTKRMHIDDFDNSSQAAAVKSLFELTLKRNHTSAVGKAPLCEIKGTIKIKAEPTVPQHDSKPQFKLDMQSEPLKIQKRIMRDRFGNKIPSLNLFLSKLLDHPLSGTAGVYLQKNKPNPEDCKPLAIYLYYEKDTLKYMALKEDKTPITGTVPTHKRGGILKKEMRLTKKDIENIKALAPETPATLSDLMKGSGFRLMSGKPTDEQLASNDNAKIYLYRGPDDKIKYCLKDDSTKTEYTPELTSEEQSAIHQFFKRKVLIDKETLYFSERTNDSPEILSALKSLFVKTAEKGHTQPLQIEALKTLTLAASTLDFSPPGLLKSFTNLFITKKDSTASKPTPTAAVKQPSVDNRPQGPGRGRR